MLSEKFPTFIKLFKSIPKLFLIAILFWLTDLAVASLVWPLRPYHWTFPYGDSKISTGTNLLYYWVDFAVYATLLYLIYRFVRPIFKPLQLSRIAVLIFLTLVLTSATLFVGSRTEPLNRVDNTGPSGSLLLPNSNLALSRNSQLDKQNAPSGLFFRGLPKGFFFQKWCAKDQLTDEFQIENCGATINAFGTPSDERFITLSFISTANLLYDFVFWLIIGAIILRIALFNKLRRT